MHFLASIDCTCSRFRSRDQHHVLIQVPMRASFQLFFPACVDFHSLKLSRWLQDCMGSSILATLFVVPCICHYFHVPVAIVKCVKICGFVTIYRGSPAKTLSHTPKMLYGKVLNNIAWGSLPKICKTLHWKTPYLSTSGAALRQLRGLITI